MFILTRSHCSCIYSPRAGDDITDEVSEERESHKRKEEVRVHLHVMPLDHHLTVSVAPVPVPRQMRQDPFSVPLPATEESKISRFSDLKLILKSGTDFLRAVF